LLVEELARTVTLSFTLETDDTLEPSSGAPGTKLPGLESVMTDLLVVELLTTLTLPLTLLADVTVEP
jgi:hypothetical protein